MRSRNRVSTAHLVYPSSNRISGRKGVPRVSLALPPCATTPCVTGCWPVKMVVCEGWVGMPGANMFSDLNFRQEGRSAGQPGFAAVRHHAMRDRVLAGEDGGMRRLGGNARSEHVFAEHSLTSQFVDVRAGGERILIASQVIGAQRICADQDNIRFCLHGSPIRPWAEFTRYSPIPAAARQPRLRLPVALRAWGLRAAGWPVARGQPYPPRLLCGVSAPYSSNCSCYDTIRHRSKTICPGGFP